jgi:hypothetical protein
MRRGLAFLILAALQLAACSSSSPDYHGETGSVAASENTMASSAPDMDASAPPFPLPAPKPSAKAEIPFSTLGSDVDRVGKVDRWISRQLDRSGYVRRSYYSVPGGFALATQVERFGMDGRSAQGARRWKLDPTGLIEMPTPFSVSGLLNALRKADPGHYRVIIFLVTTTNKTSDNAAVTADTAINWVADGGDTLPPAIAALRITPAHHLAVLIYQFSRPSVNAAVKFDDPSTLDALGHLRAAGLLGGVQ